MLTKAIFLDKLGTLFRSVPYNINPDRRWLAPAAAEGLRVLHEAGYLLIVISNQPSVALGRFTEATLRRMIRYLRSMLLSISVPLADFYYCPHHPQGVVAEYARKCACRKPSPGLIFRCALEHKVDLSNSWLIGDVLDDVEAGRRAGCKTLLIDNGNEKEWVLTPARRPDCIAGDFDDAAQNIILARRYSAVHNTWYG